MSRTMPFSPRSSRMAGREAWLRDVLAAAQREEEKLSYWERNFVDDLATRFAYRGGDLVLSARQLEVLGRIDAKVHAA